MEQLLTEHVTQIKEVRGIPQFLFISGIHPQSFIEFRRELLALVKL